MSYKPIEERLQLGGWTLFVVSSGFFLTSSFRSGDLLYMGGSIFFFLGCLLFLISLVKPGH